MPKPLLEIYEACRRHSWPCLSVSSAEVLGKPRSSCHTHATTLTSTHSCDSSTMCTHQERYSRNMCIKRALSQNRFAVSRVHSKRSRATDFTAVAVRPGHETLLSRREIIIAIFVHHENPETRVVGFNPSKVFATRPQQQTHASCAQRLFSIRPTGSQTGSTRFLET